MGGSKTQPADIAGPTVLLRWPSIVLMYIRAVIGVFLKPRWPQNTSKMPAIEVAVAMPLSDSKLLSFRRLVGYVTGLEADVPLLPPKLSAVYLMTDTFRLAMYVMTHRAFPFKILGTVVNKRARYELLQDVATGTMLHHTCRVDPEMRTTPGGHIEFDLCIQTKRADTGAAVWNATLTLVLINPKRPRGGKGDKAVADAAAEPSLTMIGSWTLPENAGRRYAALDGDRSPMHLYWWTARLMGFPRPVANVHYVMARAEAAIAQSGAAGSGVRPPIRLEGQFLAPVLLPAAVQVLLVEDGAAQGGADGADRASGDKRIKFVVRLAKNGRDVIRGSYSCASTPA